MTTLTRSDQSVLGRWWWTVDRWTIAALIILMSFGILLIQAATPAVAVKHGLNSFYFVERHIFMLVPAVLVIFGTSLLPPSWIIRISTLLLGVFLLLLAATLIFGDEIKGATRWLRIAGVTLQPSEFIKPVFTVVAAWLFARNCEQRTQRDLVLNIALFLAIIGCLISQPDIGMTFLISAIWFGQFCLAGLPISIMGLCLLLGAGGLVLAYHSLPHFTSRIDRFLSHSGDTYQVDRALDAFNNGGLFGIGPGEGTVKMSIPDAHADFVFAVAGEELGMIWCLLIVMLFAFIVLRGMLRISQSNNLFTLLAVSGLLAEFGLQALINLASTMNLMPAKGMTLPFISYGNSSLLSVALGMGMVLALTRKRFGSSG